ncbi:6-phosphogluconolactonase [Aestuariirhabdus litorea]|uniref:6-phosphogluconolactonase n=1 Tax=Aestuariirhabdus litorea TaxID=2528527 RepID=A0A3P3VJ63_9GAMM|nr:6-phosphogluconolactonase [Aestuariirhabdus litorea]RRJ82394.1 6-phosphogluconolactonase [Aestuariirhabdus litorea]RWW92557.1 6-phosphogluconolactonase [Endozoicomonadaceae bacterium GTF-13]
MNPTFPDMPRPAPSPLLAGRWHPFDHHAHCCQRLAQVMASQLSRRLKQQPRASLVLSGGSTPAPLFDRLATYELPWDRVDTTLADDRWVAPDSPDSNLHLLRTHLLQGPASATHLIPLVGEEAGPEQGQAACERRLQEMKWPIDLLLLGMGNDGHTASLFPGSPGLDAAMALDRTQRCWAMRAPSAPQQRISLGLAPLAGAADIFLLLKGEEKYQTLTRALASQDPVQMPICALLSLPQLQVWWSP